MRPTYGWTPRGGNKPWPASHDDCERCHRERPVSMDGLCLECHQDRAERRKRGQAAVGQPVAEPVEDIAEEPPMSEPVAVAVVVPVVALEPATTAEGWRVMARASRARARACTAAGDAEGAKRAQSDGWKFNRKAWTLDKKKAVADVVA